MLGSREEDWASQAVWCLGSLKAWKADAALEQMLQGGREANGCLRLQQQHEIAWSRGAGFDGWDPMTMDLARHPQRDVPHSKEAT